MVAGVAQFLLRCCMDPRPPRSWSSIPTDNPFAGLDACAAARYYAAGKVLTELGENLFGMAGGVQEATGMRVRVRHQFDRDDSRPAPYSIWSRARWTHQAPSFRSRSSDCAYCATRFAETELTVEHILPVSRGGLHEWTNVVTACRSCNTRKGNRRPEEANMPLMYVPYAVCRNEGFILSNRRILADQMTFLQASLPRHSRWAQ